MKRLVYSPKVYAYVKTDDHGIVNLSNFITSGSVSRRLDMVSSAELTIRNPNMKWTHGARRGKPVFRPMDPITIWLERIKGYPVQTFTGYLDRTPYLQLYPGTCTLGASCTLKRLLYTFWDPALPFTNHFMEKYGWIANPNGMLQNLSAENEALDKDDDPSKSLTDGSIGKILYAVLNHIGEWDPKTIHIEKLPPDLLNNIISIYTAYNEDAELVKDNLEMFLKKYIGDGSYGAGSGIGSDADALVNKGKKLGNFESTAYGPPWDAMQGTGVTADGTDLRDGKRKYVVATGPNLPFGKKLYIWPNPYNYKGAWRVADRGGAIGDRNIDFFVAEGRAKQGAWGRQTVGVWEAVAKDESGSKQASSSSNDDIEVRAASRNSDSNTDSKIYAPIKGSPSIGSGSGSDYGPRNVTGGSSYHMGVDIPVSAGTPCIAPFDGEITQAYTSGFGDVGGMIHLRATRDVAGLKKDQVIGWGHVQTVHVKSGQVKAGTHIADSGWHHVHFIYRPDGEGGADGTADPGPIYKALSKGEEAPGGTGDTGNAGAAYQDVVSTAKAAAMVQSLEWPSAAETVEAMTLSGSRSLLNDKPLMPFIEQLTNASMRSFQSLPNGNFYAFYPDYFGHMHHRKPYWFIDDIEILDAQIELSDEPLATHVFAIGDTVMSDMQSGGGIDQFERMTTTGVVNIYNVIQSGFSPDPGPGDHNRKRLREQQKDRIGRIASDPSQVMNFLKKYGARPHVEEAPMIRSPYYEAFMAYHTFNLMWSRQFLTEIQVTFMPEIYPGGLIGFANHGLQCYVDEVTHTFDYEAGFTTQVQVSAPATLGGNDSDPLSFGLVSGPGTSKTDRDIGTGVSL